MDAFGPVFSASHNVFYRITSNCLQVDFMFASSYQYCTVSHNILNQIVCLSTNFVYDQFRHRFPFNLGIRRYMIIQPEHPFAQGWNLEGWVPCRRRMECVRWSPTTQFLSNPPSPPRITIRPQRNAQVRNLLNEHGPALSLFIVPGGIGNMLKNSLSILRLLSSHHAIAADLRFSKHFLVENAVT
jgi:hypothetical protein